MTVQPLSIIIVGAGIGGLSAAIALRQAGHNVEIFESSAFATELGAAIHLPPNVVAVLAGLGMNPASWGANLAEYVTVYSKDGDVLSSKSVAELDRIYGYPWRLSHRVDLHESLKRAATTMNGVGNPVKINLRAKVASCNVQAPSITFSNGAVKTADMVIGADGIRSTIRHYVTRKTDAIEPSGGSAFRFLVDMSTVKADPITAALIPRQGELQIWEGTHRRLVIYPCRNNNELNFVCLHPDVDSPESSEGWNNNTSVEHLLRVFDEFCPAMKLLLGKADPKTLKLWRLFDHPALETWINGKIALVGDAAHPFLPHQGQGGAQAIEDSVALGALFPLGTTPAQIPERLKLYMEARYDRATLVQQFSRQMAFKTDKNDNVGGFSLDPMEFSKINFSHNASTHAKGVLSKNLAGWKPLP